MQRRRLAGAPTEQAGPACAAERAPVGGSSASQPTRPLSGAMSTGCASGSSRGGAVGGGGRRGPPRARAGTSESHARRLGDCALRRGPRRNPEVGDTGPVSHRRSGAMCRSRWHACAARAPSLPWARAHRPCAYAARAQYAPRAHSTGVVRCDPTRTVRAARAQSPRQHASLKASPRPARASPAAGSLAAP